MMELYESRVLNGVLKAYGGRYSPEQMADRLACDILITTPQARATENDLWPCIWSLAAALVRQFSGRIYVRAGLQRPLSQPVSLGPRVEFVSSCPPCAIEIAVGTTPISDARVIIQGNISGLSIMRQGIETTTTHLASPEGCFALAGYLAFEALAKAAEIPPFQLDLCKQDLLLPRSSAWDSNMLRASHLEILGLGHLGNAYLALMFFICRNQNIWPSISVVDKDRLGPENWATHVLVGEQDESCGEFKADVLAKLVNGWGCEALPKSAEVTWDWKAPQTSETFGILGFDNFDARRMACNAGYDWIVESGLSTSFTEPLLTWHSFDGKSPAAKDIFPRDKMDQDESQLTDTPFIRELKSRDAGCGFLRYAGIDASAPSMGLVAAAYGWSELINNAHAPQRTAYRGIARLWSPFLPFWRRTF